jgi:hypothetical protein
MSAEPIRVLLLPDAADPEGQPRPALAIPGRSRPTIYPSLQAALEAKRGLEEGATSHPHGSSPGPATYAGGESARVV